MRFLPWLIQVAFPRGKPAATESRYPTMHAVCVSVSVIHRPLTWTLANLTCAHILVHATAHGGVRTGCKEVCSESWLWEKNPLPHRGIEPAPAACRSDALPTELHPHPLSACFHAFSYGEVGMGSLTCATILIRAVHTRARQIMTRLHTGWLGRTESDPSPCRVQESKSGSLDLRYSALVKQPQSPVKKFEPGSSGLPADLPLSLLTLCVSKGLSYLGK